MTSVGVVLPRNAGSFSAWGARSLRERSGVLSLDESSSLDARAHQIERQGVPKVLSDLKEDFGLSWGDIALVGGVSRPALRKWREGEAMPRRDKWHRLLNLAALCEWLRAKGTAPSSWLRSPLRESGRDSGLTLLDVASVGQARLLAQFFQDRLSEGDVLARAFPGREVRPRWFRPTVLVAEGQVVIELPEFDLIASGSDQVAAEEQLVELVVEYVTDWHDRLHRYSPHRERAELIEALQGLDEVALRRRVLGE